MDGPHGRHRHRNGRPGIEALAHYQRVMPYSGTIGTIGHVFFTRLGREED